MEGSGFRIQDSGFSDQGFGVRGSEVARSCLSEQSRKGGNSRVYLSPEDVRPCPLEKKGGQFVNLSFIDIPARGDINNFYPLFIDIDFHNDSEIANSNSPFPFQGSV